MPDRRPLRRIFAPLIIALAVLFILFAIVTWMPLRSARSQWRSGHVADAIDTAQSWSRAMMWPNQYHQILALAYETSGHDDGAQPHLDALRGKTLWLSLVAKDEVARQLFAQRRYASFVRYDDAVHERSEPADTPLYRAAAYAIDPATLPRAYGVLRSINRSAVDPKKLAALQSALDQRRSGSYPYVIDRDGKPVAMYNVAPPNDVTPVNADFGALVNGANAQFSIAAQKQRLGTAETIETTLDTAIQHAAKQALASYRGAFVVIDPRTNELLAIASNDPHGSAADLALEQQYEPGSIIKVLTGLNAISNGVNVGSLFPYHCNGELMIDGRHFGDWLPAGHGTLPDIEEALAQSCNVFFADVGIRLGRDRLRTFMTSAGFDGQTDLGLFKVPLGRLKGDVFNKFETAYMSIGLEHESVTALHVAMLASMMANRGVLTTPRLLRARRSILGETVAGEQKQAQARLASRDAAQRMVQAMVAVVYRPKGTGRRADIEGVPLALKTGTAGKRENGYQAVIMAFAPVDAPRIAFGIVAENAGPAEFAGAKIAHDFMAAISDRLK